MLPKSHDFHSGQSMTDSLTHMQILLKILAVRQNLSLELMAWIAVVALTTEKQRAGMALWLIKEQPTNGRQILEMAESIARRFPEEPPQTE